MINLINLMILLPLIEGSSVRAADGGVRRGGGAGQRRRGRGEKGERGEEGNQRGDGGEPTAKHHSSPPS